MAIANNDCTYSAPASICFSPFLLGTKVEKQRRQRTVLAHIMCLSPLFLSFPPQDKSREPIQRQRQTAYKSGAYASTVGSGTKRARASTSLSKDSLHQTIQIMECECQVGKRFGRDDCGDEYGCVICVILYALYILYAYICLHIIIYYISA